MINPIEVAVWTMAFYGAYSFMRDTRKKLKKSAWWKTFMEVVKGED